MALPQEERINHINDIEAYAIALSKKKQELCIS
jgi:hypothetical protein